MIRRVTDAVSLSYLCEQVGGEFVYSVEIVYGKNVLLVRRGGVPPTTGPIRDLLQAWSAGLEAVKKLGSDNQRRRTELPPYVPGQGLAVLEARLRRQKEMDDENRISCREKEANIQRIKQALRQELRSIPIDSPLITSCNGRHYALHEGSLWTSARRLDVQQWLGLIAQAVVKEEAQLKSVLAHKDAVSQRPAIPSAVRIEVWRRDGGLCVRCGSRERLEYDHIIPISRGGSNTARNIELLCETCNRVKSASIS
jgi:hypothetical protein